MFADDIRGQVTAVESVITKARSLEGDFELNGVLIALLIIFKLPETSSIRADLIVKNQLPTPGAILLQLQQIAAFAPGASVFNDPTGLLAADDRRNGRSGRNYRNCHNCDGTYHQGFDCPLAKADCAVCGIGAGHLDKHLSRAVPARDPELDLGARQGADPPQA